MNFLDNLAASVGEAHNKGDEIIRQLWMVNQQLAHTLETLSATTENLESFVIEDSGVADGAGNLNLTFDKYPRKPGFTMDLISYAATAALGGGLLFFQNDTNPRSLLWTDSTSTFFSNAFPEELYLPEGANLIARFTGLAAAQAVTVTVRGMRKRLNQPHKEA